MTPIYHDRVVAFIDILAFTSLVARLENDVELHSKLQSALKAIRVYKEIAGKEQYAQKNLEVSVFSDSIVISAEPKHLFDVIWSSMGLQSRLLTLGVLTRGGISIGKTVHEKDILYGEGMIKAYRLETGAAIYPRVVIDPTLIVQIPEAYRERFLTQDYDGLWFVDCFADGLLPPGSDALVEDGWDPHHVALLELGKLIEQEILRTRDADHQMKWQWLERQRSHALQYLEKHGAPRIFHQMKLHRTADA
jgi:hypothetical protein